MNNQPEVPTIEDYELEFSDIDNLIRDFDQVFMNEEPIFH